MTVYEQISSLRSNFKMTSVQVFFVFGIEFVLNLAGNEGNCPKSKTLREVKEDVEVLKNMFSLKKYAIFRRLR